MAQIQEVNTLNTVASVRRAAQESMRPVIQEIQNKMITIQTNMKEISKQILQFTGIDKKMQRNQESNRHLHGQVLQLSDSLHHAQLEIEIDREKMEKIDENFKQEVRKIYREIQKQNLTLHNFEVKNDQTLNQLNNYLKRMKSKEQEMQSKFLQIVEFSEKLKTQTNKTTSQMKGQFQDMKNRLNRELKQTSKRLELLDMYENQKDLTFEKFNQVFSQLQFCIKVSQFQYYKQCANKERQAVLESVKKILQDNLSEQTREFISDLPRFKTQLQHCMMFEKNIQKVEKKVGDINSQIHQIQLKNKEQKDHLSQYMKNNLADIEKKREMMSKKIEEALALEGLIQTKIDEYSDILKAEMRSENQRKSKELYDEIKKKFADSREAMREKQLQQIIEQRKKLFEKCDQIQTLGGKINFVLSNYSSKFTKMRSDHQLFEERVKKELQKLEDLRKCTVSTNDLIGKTLAEMIEAILTSYCIDIELNSSPRDQVLLTTLKDGVIYQKFSNNYRNGYLMYRRKLVDPEVLRRAVAFSLLQTYDQLMDSTCCLKWHEHSPGGFFKNTVQPIYLNLNDKKQVKPTPKSKESIEFSTIQPRQTTTDFDFHSRNISSMRERRNRYTSFESGQIFKQKSTRRVRGALNSSLGMT